MQQWRLNLLRYLSESWQYRWQGLATAWLACLIGWVGIALIPNTYQSIGEVYIDTHGLLNPLLKGLAVTPDPNQEIAVVMQTLLSDPTLQRVVRETHPNAASMSSDQMQDAVTKLRQHVSLKNLLAKDFYSITYSDHNPAHSQLVAQTLLSVLIDSSVGGQRRDADQVGSFLEKQIANYEQKLKAADKRRADFKTAHVQFFASTSDGDKMSGVGDVVAAQAAVAESQNALSEANGRRNSLRSQVEATPQTLDVNSPLPATMDRTGTAINPRTQLAAAIAKLNELRVHFTDQHPDIVAQKRLIKLLKSQPDNSNSSEAISNPAYVMLMSKLADTETEVAVDQNRLSNAQKRLEDARNMTAEAIAVQREYENLDRDYQVLQKNSQELASRRESATITQAAGDQQSSFVFRVVSPPIQPDRPVAPNRLPLNAAVLLVGLAAGGGIAFALGQFSGRFMDLGKLKDAFELPVLGAITTVRTDSDISAAMQSNTRFAAGLSMLMITCVILLYFFRTPLAAGGSML